MTIYLNETNGEKVQEMISELTLNKTEVNNLTLYLGYFAQLRMDQIFSSVWAHKYSIMGKGLVKFTHPHMELTH